MEQLTQIPGTQEIRGRYELTGVLFDACRHAVRPWILGIAEFWSLTRSLPWTSPASCRGVSSGGVLVFGEWVFNGEGTEAATVLQVFGDEPVRSCVDGCLDDQ